MAWPRALRPIRGLDRDGGFVYPRRAPSQQRTLIVYDLSLITPDHFESLLGQELPLAGTDHALQVHSVERLRSPSPRPAPFSVVLLAPAGMSGAQGMYTLVHPVLGELPLFLVPIEPESGRSRLELVFN